MIIPTRGPARQWLALEEAFGREPVLAPSTTSTEPPGTELQPFDVCASSHKDKGAAASSQRNVFAIIVSYYVKVRV